MKINLYLLEDAYGNQFLETEAEHQQRIQEALEAEKYTLADSVALSDFLDDHGYTAAEILTMDDLERKAVLAEFEDDYIKYYDLMYNWTKFEKDIDILPVK